RCRRSSALRHADRTDRKRRTLRMIETRLSIFAVVCLIFATAAIAQELGGQRNQTFTERYGQQLSLTDTQKKQIDDLDKTFQEENATFIESYQKTMTEFREARQA